MCFAGDNYNDDNYLSISRVPDVEDVISAASGQHHTVVLKQGGTVLTWGDNKYGQLGIDPDIAPSVFVPSEVYSEPSFEKVYAGWTHTAALTQNGDVFMWGRNSYGQLGAERENPFKPAKLEALGNIDTLSLGSEHNLALTKDSKLYCWGWNEHGNCGTGDKEDVKIPKQIFVGKKVRFAAACTGHSFAVVE